MLGRVGAIVLLLEDDTPAVPGEETRRALQICNAGSVVDRFELDVVGDAKDWIRVEPAEVNVFPDQSAGAELVFTPPRSTDLPAGEVTFALRVMSHEDIEGSVVEEATVTVGSFTDFGVKLLPRTRRARLGARFHAVVDNRGNAPLRVQLYAADPDAGLGFTFSYKEIEVTRGTGSVVPVKVKPAARRWRGADLTLPFQVLAVHRAEGGEEEQTADGAVVQAALVSDAVVKFVMAVAAAVVALIALWLFVLKPSVESEARRQASAVVGEESGPPGNGTGESPPPDGATESPGAGQAGGPGADRSPPPSQDTGSGSGGGAGGGGGRDDPGDQESQSEEPPGDQGGGGEAFDFRLEADAPVSAEFDAEATYTVPEGSTLYLIDVVYENVAGDAGVVRLQRGNSVLRQLALDTFRNLDESYEQPIEFGPGENVVLAVRCQDPAAQSEAPAQNCTPAAYFSGRLVKAGT
ncbi:hypothetical protein DN051_41640 (plasmid) [Streptomyces cadmiisoli]|uniref:Hydrolytic protein n=1 Tax=Streptomyces cadmiisoli TaxID=2184053 RepID=A0A2Z4JDE5_9ACTN|nr:hypothetical protein DN051_41640 [Streptomyces cadmiisoli]